MIHIFDDYYIQVTEICYTIMKKGVVESGKEKGNDKYTAMGFYGSLETALQGLVKKAAGKMMEDKELTLKQAIETLGEYTRRVEALVLEMPERGE